MESNPNQTPIAGSDESGSASQQQSPVDGSTDQKEASSPTAGPLPIQSFSQHQPARRYQHPDAPPPKWARVLVRLILESSSP